MTKRDLAKAEGPVPVELAHVALLSTDVVGTAGWYDDVLGSAPTMVNEVAAVTSYDADHHRVAIANVDMLPFEVDSNLQHIAYRVGKLEELLANYLRLKEDLGIEPAYCIHHTATISMYYIDPDGVHNELFVDAFSLEAAREMLRKGDQLGENPIGNPFDPDALVARYRNGESIDSLLEPPPFDPELLAPFFEANGIQEMPEGMFPAADV
jgi:hypothetical protein